MMTTTTKFTMAPLVGKAQVGSDGVPTYVFRMTSDALDRQGEVVTMDGWKFDAYMANPVVLDTHAYESIGAIVGRCTSIERDADGWNAEVRFNGTPGGRLAAQLVEDGDLRAVSVGFRPLAIEYPDAGSARSRDAAGKALVNVAPDAGRAVRHIEKELLELSVVPIPANPYAVRIRSAGDGGAGVYDGDEAGAGSGPPVADAGKVDASSDTWRAVAGAMHALLLDADLGDATRRRAFAGMERAYRALGKVPPDLPSQDVIARLGDAERDGLFWHGEPGIVAGDAASKAGRVLSGANEARLRQALAMISEVLASMGEPAAEPEAEPPSGVEALAAAGAAMRAVMETWK